ncbi:hypothetical protein ACFXPX_36635 [Kitasatospora sp. NPDC059146]|uniref:hypothetical protein n=1 Tax=unclassified Kitasatospora TaxID=2633591 RepID=UPI0036957724
MAGQLAAVAARHGLPVAESANGDVADWPVLGPGVHRMPPVGELVIRDHEAGAPAFGAHLTHYAARHGTLTLLPEVPRWHSAVAFGDSPPVALAVLAEALTGEVAEVRRLMEQAGHLDGAFARAAADTAAITEAVARSWQRRAAGQDAVPGGELAEAHYTHVTLSLRSAGMALRAVGEAPPGRAVLQTRARLERLLFERARRCERELRAAPIRLGDLVAVQACAALAAVELTR